MIQLGRVIRGTHQIAVCGCGVVVCGCYNQPPKFSSFSSSSVALPLSVIPHANLEPSSTLMFPSVLPKLSLPPKVPALLPVIPMPEPHPYLLSYLPFPAIEPYPPTPPIPWSQHTYQYLSMEHPVEQKLENISSEPDSPMSNANSQEEPTIMIPLEWPSQQSIPEPSHMQSPEPMEFNPYPVVPSNHPPLDLIIHEDPPSPSSSLGKCSTSPSSTVSQPQYAHLWDGSDNIPKHSPTYEGTHTVEEPHAQSPSRSTMGSPMSSIKASPSALNPTISLSDLTPESTPPSG